MVEVVLFECDRCGIVKLDDADMVQHSAYCGGAFKSLSVVPSSRIAVLEGERDRLREALEWYADESNYNDGMPGEWQSVGMGAAIDYYGDPNHQEFEGDHGERARAALESLPGGPESAS